MTATQEEANLLPVPNGQSLEAVLRDRLGDAAKEHEHGATLWVSVGCA